MNLPPNVIFCSLLSGISSATIQCDILSRSILVSDFQFSCKKKKVSVYVPECLSSEGSCTDLQVHGYHSYQYL
jgi:hypothetical protein